MKFSELYINYYPKLVKFAMHYLSYAEAEDITQDIFIELWDKFEVVKTVSNIDGYVYKILKNRCLDALKHKCCEENYAHKCEIEYKIKSESLEIIDDIFESDRNVVIMNNIIGAVDTLPKRCREIFILSKLEGLKYSQISEKLGVSTNTIENQMNIALKKLRASTLLTQLNECC